MKIALLILILSTKMKLDFPILSRISKYQHKAYTNFRFEDQK